MERNQRVGSCKSLAFINDPAGRVLHIPDGGAHLDLRHMGGGSGQTNQFQRGQLMEFTIFNQMDRDSLRNPYSPDELELLTLTPFESGQRHGGGVRSDKYI